jgi:hypothetical protein
MKKSTFNFSMASKLCAALLSLGSFVPGIMNAQATYTFTSAGLTGPVGPNQTQINTAYGSTNLSGSVTVTGGIQSFTIPVTGPYRITAIGGQGGYNGGYGAMISGDFTLSAGTVLKILVGQAGTQASNGTYIGGGGGGGSYVTSPTNVPYVVAGGGGGNGDGYGGSPVSCCLSGMQGTTSTSGNPYPGGANGGTGGMGGSCGTANAGAGAGIYGDGSLCNALGAAYSFTNGGLGGYCGYLASTSGDGGFGGGGGCYNSGTGQRGGGGGGYSGGGGGMASTGLEPNAPGGGGGSFNSGANQTNTVATSGGSGKVIVELLCFISLTASTPNPTLPIICSGNTVTLTTNAASGILWSTGSTSTSIVVNPTSNTTYSVTGTSTAACSAAAAVVVTVSAGVPTLAINNPSPNICLGRTATLTATGAITYSWTGGITNAQTFTPSTTTSYTVTGANGCGTGSAVATVTVAPLAVGVTASPTLVCQGYTSTLTASSAVNGYTWQPNNQTFSLITVSPTSNSIYTVTASDGTCSGTATIQVMTKTTPTIIASVNNSVICEGDVITLTASGAQTYIWSPGNLSGPTVTANPTAPTAFNVAGTNSLNCTANANVIVLVNPGPTLTINANKPLVCPGGALIITAGGAGGNGSYNWTGGPPTASYAVNPQNTTVYTVVGTNSNNCSATKNYTAPVYSPSLTVTASPTAVCPGGSAILQASGATSYSWVTTNVQSPSFVNVSPATTTIYPVNATSTASLGVSCLISNTIQLTVHPVPQIGINATKTELCKNEPAAILTATGATTYTWTNNATTTTISASNIVTNTYSVNGTNAQGCDGTMVGVKVTVNPCTGISEQKDLNYVVKVYPNPSNGAFTISSDVEVSLKLMNELGQQIKVIILNEENDYKVDVRDLSAGIYFITGSESGNFNQKIIINK